MNRLILRFLNLPILLFLTAMAIAVQSSLFTPWPLRYFQPDFVLLVVIWCALKRGFGEGGLITLAIGEFAELHSAIPQGIFLVSYMSVYLAIRAADKVFVLPTETSMVKVTMASSGVWHLAMMISLALISPTRQLWRQMFVHVVPSAVMAALLGVWIYRGLEKFDLVTFKNTSAENVDEFQIENLGL